jgi:hypothetical protein
MHRARCGCPNLDSLVSPSVSVSRSFLNFARASRWMRPNFANGRTVSRVCHTAYFNYAALPATDEKSIHLRPRVISVPPERTQYRGRDVTTRNRTAENVVCGTQTRRRARVAFHFYTLEKCRVLRSCCTFLVVVADARQMEMQIAQNVGFSRKT